MVRVEDTQRSQPATDQPPTKRRFRLTRRPFGFILLLAVLVWLTLFFGRLGFYRLPLSSSAAPRRVITAASLEVSAIGRRLVEASVANKGVTLVITEDELTAIFRQQLVSAGRLTLRQAQLTVEPEDIELFGLWSDLFSAPVTARFILTPRDQALEPGLIWWQVGTVRQPVWLGQALLGTLLSSGLQSLLTVPQVEVALQSGQLVVKKEVN